MPSPMGSMDIPEPTVKKLIPAIRRRVPKRNSTKTPEFSGAKVMLNIRTIAAIGNTDCNASNNELLMCCIGTPL